MSIGVGDRAPEFTLPGTGDREYSLADYAGAPVVLVFYPGDDTPVCTKQLNTYNNGLEQFAELGAQVLAISAQDVASHERFSDKHASRSPCSPTPTRPWLRRTGRSVRSASRGAACSSSTATA